MKSTNSVFNSARGPSKPIIDEPKYHDNLLVNNNNREL